MAGPSRMCEAPMDEALQVYVVFLRALAQGYGRRASKRIPKIDRQDGRDGKTLYGTLLIINGIHILTAFRVSSLGTDCSVLGESVACPSLIAQEKERTMQPHWWNRIFSTCDGSKPAFLPPDLGFLLSEGIMQYIGKRRGRNSDNVRRTFIDIQGHRCRGGRAWSILSFCKEILYSHTRWEKVVAGHLQTGGTVSVAPPQGDRRS